MRKIMLLLALILLVTSMHNPLEVKAKGKKLPLRWIVDPTISWYNDIEPIRGDLASKERGGNFDGYYFVLNDEGYYGDIINFNNEYIINSHRSYLTKEGLNIYSRYIIYALESEIYLYNNKLKVIGDIKPEKTKNVGTYININTGKLYEFNDKDKPIKTKRKLEAGIYPAIKIKGNHYEILKEMVFVNEKGSILKNKKFEEGGLLRSGLALAKKNGKWGFVDKSGKNIINYQYDNAYSFRDGVAPVKKNGKWGYIYKDGSVCIDFVLEEARPSYNSRGWAKISGQWGVLNLSSKEVKKIENKFFDYRKPKSSYINGIPLEHNKSVYYDLDGDGKKEKIDFNVKKVQYASHAMELYINNKLVYEHNNKGVDDYRLHLYDIDKKDSQLDLFISGDYTDMQIHVFMGLGRYSKGKFKIVKEFKEGDLRGKIEVNKNQDGTFNYRTNNMSYTVGYYGVTHRYKIVNGKFNKLSSKQKIHRVHNTLNRNVRVYEKSDKKSKVKFKLNKGDIVMVKKVVKKDKIEYVYIQTLDGKVGWLIETDYALFITEMYLS